MSKKRKVSVSFDLESYPFKRCHLDCDNNCRADEVWNKEIVSVKQRIHEDFYARSGLFINLLNHMNAPEHGIELPEGSEPIERYLQLLKVKDTGCIQKLFNDYSITGFFNNCRCCSTNKRKIIKATIIQKRNKYYNTYYVCKMSNGYNLKFDQLEMQQYTCACPDPAGLNINDSILLGLHYDKYIKILENILWEHIFDRETNYLPLPKQYTLFAATKAFMDADIKSARKTLSPVGQLMNAWVINKNACLFIPANCMTIECYNKNIGLWPRRRYSKNLKHRHVHKLKRFLYQTFPSYSGTFVVPEDSKLFEAFLDEIHMSPRTITAF
jgi:hypothetical protein